MTGSTDHLGYRRVTLRRADATKPITRAVHTLVALAFLGERPREKTDVAHLDGKPGNNSATNLAWSTHAENSRMMLLHGTAQTGEKSCTAKLTSEQVTAIRAAARAGGKGSQKAIAAQYGVSRAQICRIVNGSRWAHL